MSVNQLQEESAKYELVNKKINNEHDKIFRKILDNKQEAVNFINKTLNLKIDKEKFEKYSTSFVTDSLKNQETDIIYKLKDRKIFFLIEHQTKIDYSMPYRIIEYEREIMKSAIDFKKLNQKGYKLPLVLTIVLYTGRKKWDVEKYIREKQELLEKYEDIQFEKYNVVDVNEYNNEELLNDSSFLSKAMLLEKAKNKEELTEYIEKIVLQINKNKELFSDELKELLITIINLVLKEKIGKEKAQELVKILKGGNKNMLAFMEMIEEEDKKIFRRGKREGRIENKIETAKAMIKENISIDVIMRITKLSKKEIDKLK